jgi:hypothetical protein
MLCCLRNRIILWRQLPRVTGLGSQLPVYTFRSERLNSRPLSLLFTSLALKMLSHECLFLFMSLLGGQWDLRDRSGGSAALSGRGVDGQRVLLRSTSNGHMFHNGSRFRRMGMMLSMRGRKIGIRRKRGKCHKWERRRLRFGNESI